MAVNLKKATIQDGEKIHEMQIVSFKPLLEKYKDYDTSPGVETLDKVRSRFAFDNVDHFLISLGDESIGYIRIHRIEESTCRLSQIFIISSFQSNGYAQTAIKQVELFYPKAKKWILDTIKQEAKLCYLYEKMGYRITGIEKNIKENMDLVYYEKCRL
ncbi:MAG: GNAT family N-acetyltransferase [Firmicutes bacterium]|nr:GNAT family N-acetyltransferase [Bacillota bacterium]